jgi:hypothetical protein
MLVVIDWEVLDACGDQIGLGRCLMFLEHLTFQFSSSCNMFFALSVICSFMGLNFYS